MRHFSKNHTTVREIACWSIFLAKTSRANGSSWPSPGHPSPNPQAQNPYTTQVATAGGKKSTPLWLGATQEIVFIELKLFCPFLYKYGFLLNPVCLFLFVFQFCFMQLVLRCRILKISLCVLFVAVRVWSCVVWCFLLFSHLLYFLSIVWLGVRFRCYTFMCCLHLFLFFLSVFSLFVIVGFVCTAPALFPDCFLCLFGSCFFVFCFDHSLRFAGYLACAATSSVIMLCCGFLLIFLVVCFWLVFISSVLHCTRLSFCLAWNCSVSFCFWSIFVFLQAGQAGRQARQAGRSGRQNPLAHWWPMRR